VKPIKVLLLIISIAFTSNVLAQTVYTTKTGEKYHKSSCKYLKYSKKETTIDKAKALAFVACKVCKPTEENTSSSNLNLSSNSKPPKTSSSSKKAVASQCTGKTKSGSRCKRKTKNVNGRCYQH